MRFNAAVSTAIESDLNAPARPAGLLGGSDAAAYLLVEGQVVALLAPDAVRLPCALVLGALRPSLASIRPDEPVLVGEGCVRWTGRSGAVVVQVTRRWRPARVEHLRGDWTDRLEPLRSALESLEFGIPADLLSLRGVELALALLGLGPGLTPSGDDVLAGLLLGARAFGAPLYGLPAAIAEQAPRRTTALSGRLLRHAADGECVPEVAAVVAGLDGSDDLGPAIAALLQIGHTSGAALGRGLLMAADLALIPAG